jgi:16S rRNA (cytosine967-C5)-methyltransferase
LKRRAARAKVFNYRAVLWDGGAKLPTKTKFDGILVDAPCSGTGTWQRNPQSRWTTFLQDVKELAEVQKQLLANAATALKPGGRLIYSVCTLTRSETTEVAEAITKRFADLKPLGLKNPFKQNGPEENALWLWPQETEGNGMFICAWQKPAAS